MSTRMNTPKNIFLKSLYGLGFAIFLAVLVYTRADKSKSEFSKVNGKLISIGKSSLLAPRQDTVKYLYLLIDDYPKKFEIFRSDRF